MQWIIASSEIPSQINMYRNLIYDDEKKEFIFELFGPENQKVELRGEDAALAFLAYQLQEISNLIRLSNAKRYKIIPDDSADRKDRLPDLLF